MGEKWSGLGVNTKFVLGLSRANQVGLEHAKKKEVWALAFLCRFWTQSHLTTKPYNFDIKCQSNSESYDQHVFLGPSLGGGQTFLLTVGCFFNKRKYSEADWLVPLLPNTE